MSKCLGCGAQLQTTDKNHVGYTPKAEVEYCQRCFRLRHYGDLLDSFEHTSDNSKILDAISKMNALFFWVVDLFDFESNFVENINRYLKGKDITIVLTKRDLLPDTLSQKKLQTFVDKRLQFHQVQVLGYVVTGEHGYDGRDQIISAIDQFRENRDVVFLGLANAGKSTLLNAIFDNQDITTSPYPGTTLEINSFEYDDCRIYDTPGFNNKRSVLWNVDNEYIKDLLPGKGISEKVYQLKDNQSFALGGIARVDIIVKKPVTAVFYFAETLAIHRGKLENADVLWQQHYGELLRPTLKDRTMKREMMHKKGDNFDLVIPGLGWISFKGELSEISIWIHPDIFVFTREAMI